MKKTACKGVDPSLMIGKNKNMLQNEIENELMYKIKVMKAHCSEARKVNNCIF